MVKITTFTYRYLNKINGLFHSKIFQILPIKINNFESNILSKYSRVKKFHIFYKRA